MASFQEQADHEHAEDTVPTTGPAAVPGLRCSIIVPAHDEAAVLSERLGPLAAALDGTGAELIVVANGCTDQTAVAARQLPGVRVIELAEASKPAALNAGDRAASSFPRIYLDADVQIEAETLAELARQLDREAPVVATPRVHFDLSDASWPVRAFYAVFRQLPYVRRGLVGLGVYGLSGQARRRFGKFPDVVADDLFIQRLFAEDERLTAPGTFQVIAPRTLRGLLAVRTRVARGNAELSRRGKTLGLEDSSSGSDTARALLRTARRSPRWLVAVIVYVLVTLVARGRASTAAGRTAWERDESSRTAVPSGGRVLVDGVGFDPLTEEQAVEHVRRDLGAGRGGVIVTPNVDIHRHLRRRGFEHVLGAADLVLADGMPIVWASRLQGRALPERVAGATLVWSLARAAAAGGHRVFLLGAAPAVAAGAAERLGRMIPGLEVAGWYSPPVVEDFDAAELARIIDTLSGARPDLVLVALGFPKQENLMVELRQHFPAAWFIGCGGSLDLIAGRKVRAPQLVQRLGLEWTFRLAQEPRRLFKRYVIDDIPYAIGLLSRSVLRRRRPSGASAG
jgi:exopolysaccharide biosynthesis WecB/TagA/CpsF family protein